MKYITLTFFALIMSAYAISGTVICSGKIERLSYHAPNQLMIKLDSMNAPVFFCNPDAEFSVPGTAYVTGPDTCKALYSTFLAAKMAGRTISSMYFDGDDAPSTCNSWGDWKKANIRHYAF